MLTNDKMLNGASPQMFNQGTNAGNQKIKTKKLWLFIVVKLDFVCIFL
jgi:hypothetical protein